MSTCSWSGQGEQATWPKTRLDSFHWVTMVKSQLLGLTRVTQLWEKSLRSLGNLWFILEANQHQGILPAMAPAVCNAANQLNSLGQPITPKLSVPPTVSYHPHQPSRGKKRFKNHVSLTKFLPVLYILICNFKCLHFTSTWLQTLKRAMGTLTINLHHNSSETV